MIGNFGAKQNLYFIFSATPLLFKHVSAPLGIIVFLVIN